MSLPAYIEVGRRATERISHLGSFASVNLENPLVVVGKRPTTLPAFLETCDAVTLQDNSIEHATILAARCHEYSTVIGVGTGRVVDPAKWAASQSDRPFICVPTTLSNDGIASPISILADSGRTTSYASRSPRAILVDTEQVARSPKNLIRSGVGDLLANWNANDDAALDASQAQGAEDSFANHLAVSAALLVTAQRSELMSCEFLTSLAHGLILSGTAMEIAGSSQPASGSEHEISHAIDELFPGSAPHGDQVSVATAYMGYLRSAPWLDAVVATMKYYGVPMLPGHLGLTPDQFSDAIEHAPDTRPRRWTLLEKMSMSRGEIERTVDAFINSQH